MVERIAPYKANAARRAAVSTRIKHHRESRWKRLRQFHQVMARSGAGHDIDDKHALAPSLNFQQQMLT